MHHLALLLPALVLLRSNTDRMIIAEQIEGLFSVIFYYFVKGIPFVFFQQLRRSFIRGNLRENRP